MYPAPNVEKIILILIGCDPIRWLLYTLGSDPQENPSQNRIQFLWHRKLGLFIFFKITISIAVDLNKCRIQTISVRIRLRNTMVCANVDQILLFYRRKKRQKQTLNT